MKPDWGAEILHLTCGKWGDTLRTIELSADLARSRLERLEATVCEAERVVRTRLDARKRRASLRRRVRQAVLGVGGAGVVGFNATTDAITTFGLAPWASAVSGALGGALIEKAIDK